MGDDMPTTARNVYYLGPEGSFTHQAALQVHRAAGLPASYRFRLVPVSQASEIIDRVQSHRGWGMIAWDNTVEGYVVPNLDGLIDAGDAVGLARTGVDVTFQAFTLPTAMPQDAAVGATGEMACGDGPQPLSQAVLSDAADPDDPIAGWQVHAHPHGLAQCARFISRHGLIPVPAASNAAACRDLKDRQVALGPALCGDLYGLRAIASHVEDFPGARTDFLLIAPREEAVDITTRMRESALGEFETIMAMVPLNSGAGVLANLLDVLRDAGLNMTSFISRPIKGHAGTYSFVATIVAAPWQPRLSRVMETMLRHGDWIKTLAVYPRREMPNPPVDTWMLPTGGVHLSNDGDLGHADARSDHRRGRPDDGNIEDIEDIEDDETMMRRQLLW